MNNELPESCRGVQQFLSENGTGSQVRIVPGIARTAQEAANALGWTQSREQR